VKAADGNEDREPFALKRILRYRTNAIITTSAMTPKITRATGEKFGVSGLAMRRAYQLKLESSCRPLMQAPSMR